VEPIDVGNSFSTRLVNRNKRQGDGKFNAVDFRTLYLTGIDNAEAWKNDDTFISFNFKNVRKLAPSFANEAFAYFMKYEISLEKFHTKIQIINWSEAQKLIIEKELRSAGEER
jgi:hypothetical protein